MRRLDSKSSNKHVALQNLSIYYTTKNIRGEDKNNKFKIIAPMWNDEFGLADDSYSVVLLRYSILWWIHLKKTWYLCQQD